MKQSDDKNRINDAFWKYNTEYVILWKKGERSNAEQFGRGSTLLVALFPQAWVAKLITGSPSHQEFDFRLAAGRISSAGRWVDIPARESKYGS